MGFVYKNGITPGVSHPKSAGPSIGKAGVQGKRAIFPVCFNFKANGTTAFYDTAALAIVLRAQARINLRMFKVSDESSLFGTFSPYFTDSGNIGNQCTISGLIKDETYQAMWRVQPFDLDTFREHVPQWTKFGPEFIQNAEPQDEDIVIT